MKGFKYIALVLLYFFYSCTSNQTGPHLYEESQSLDEIIHVNSNAIKELKELLKTEKFGPEEKTDQLPLGYVGFLPSESRPLANSLLNESIKRLISILSENKNITQRMILNEFEVGLNSFNDLAFDTEDRERVCWYYEDMMDIIGIESTNELLNNWMY
jgi:hypothetical protein